MARTKGPEPFTLAVEAVIRAIPIASVMTYGQVAAEAGNPQAARQVARVLSSRSGPSGLPWWRVAGAGRGGHAARISLRGEGFVEQAARLRVEGLAVSREGDIDFPPNRREKALAGAASSAREGTAS